MPVSPFEAPAAPVEVGGGKQSTHRGEEGAEEEALSDDDCIEPVEIHEDPTMEVPEVPAEHPAAPVQSSGGPAVVLESDPEQNEKGDVVGTFKDRRNWLHATSLLITFHSEMSRARFLYMIIGGA